MRLLEVVRFNLVARCSVLLPCNMIKTCVCDTSVSMQLASSLVISVCLCVCLSVCVCVCVCLSVCLSVCVCVCVRVYRLHAAST